MESWMVEAWTYFVLGLCIIGIRIFARTKFLRGWKGDDYLIIISTILFTIEIGLWYGISLGSHIPFKPNNHTPEQLRIMRRSYKCNFAVWIVYSSFIWSLKGCLCFFYLRLSYGLWQQKLVHIAAIMCAISYVVVILELVFHCTPIRLNWQVYPYPGPVCGSGMVNFYVVGSLNLITDAILLSVPVPMLWKVQLPAKKKLALSLLLCSGVFVMVATLIRNVFGLLAVVKGVGIKNKGWVLSWALRENFVLLLIVNIPVIWPLFNKNFRERTLSSQSKRDGEDQVEELKCMQPVRLSSRTSSPETQVETGQADEDGSKTKTKPIDGTANVGKQYQDSSWLDLEQPPQNT